MEPLEREIYSRYFELGRFRPMPNRTRNVPLEELLESYEAFFFDAFGTFYGRKERLYPGALEMYKKARATGKPMRLVTNAASMPTGLLAESLSRMRIPFEESEIISSGTLFPAFAKKMRIREAFYIGKDTGIPLLEKSGITVSREPSEPTVVVSSTAEDESLFRQAVEILSKPNAKLIVLNPDAYAPRIGKPREGVSGCTAHLLYKATKTRTFYLGKPFPAIFEKALDSLPHPMKTVMIGDTLATDVGGALNAGIDAALLIGRNQPAAELDSDEAFLKIRPTCYLVDCDGR